MGRLRQSIINLLANSLSKRVGDLKQVIVFLINNYSAVLKVYHDKNLQSETSETFKGLMHTQVAKYVEMELSEKFGVLIKFVNQSEERVATAQERKEKLPALDLETAANIVRDFAKNWQRKIQQIDSHVTSHFGRAQPESAYKSSEILKQILIQLVLYYQRLQDVIKKCHRRPPSFMKELVPIPNIMHEIKKYGNR
mmetsp:Transcript_4265/g.8448  ORF Transcript_4265/g.8448 Transcript_4265/m.8448 type:complete len:196 (-) Transcript_4265:134-721(-)